jgi:exodeoxyribonuclease III
MKIASFNINGIKARARRADGLARRGAPTSPCLQEIKSVDEGFPRD